MRTLMFPGSRDKLVSFLPPGGTVAEIGVAEGDFSRAILDQNRPRALHLVDPWIHHDDARYAPDISNLAAPAQETRYLNVARRFEAEIATGVVHLHRMTSARCESVFEDAFFDWVFVDAQHHYDAVLEDLTTISPKIRKGGVIVGHDFANNAPAQNMNFGVIEAVLDFTARGEWRLLVLTLENYPTYLLVRADEPDSDVATSVVLKTLAEFRVVVDVDPARLRNVSMPLFSLPDGSRAMLVQV